MRQVKILERAVRDLRSGAVFYDRFSPGLGNYFLETLIAEIDSLEEVGGIHSVRSGFHRMLFRRFPFAVYYDIEVDTVIVFRVLDCREDPEAGEKKLKMVRTKRER